MFSFIFSTLYFESTLDFQLTISYLASVFQLPVIRYLVDYLLTLYFEHPTTDSNSYLL